MIKNDLSQKPVDARVKPNAHRTAIGNLFRCKQNEILHSNTNNCVFKGNSTDVIHQSLLKGLGEYHCIKPFVASEGAVQNQIDGLKGMSLESVLFGAEDYKLKTTSLKEKEIQGWSEKEVRLPNLCRPPLCLRLAARGYISLLLA